MDFTMTQPSEDGFSKTFYPVRNPSCGGSLKRPKAIGLQRFDFSLVGLHDDYSKGKSGNAQQLTECNRSTSDKTWERSSCRESWASISASLPCLPICSSTSGDPTYILPFLYLGSQHDALSEDVIRKNGITHILNVSTSSPRSPFIPDKNFLRISVNDSHTDRLLPYFQEAFQFLDEVNVSQGCVLVHCLAGISRSPTLVIAYIMHYFSLSMDDAYRFVKEKRPSISPNFNFLGQLVEFESLLCQGLTTKRSEAKEQRPLSSEDIPQPKCMASEHHAPGSINDSLNTTETPHLNSSSCLMSCASSCSPGISTDSTCAFRREWSNPRFPTNWEMQFSQVSTDSLDQLCFTPCFAVPPADDAESRNSDICNNDRVADSHKNIDNTASSTQFDSRHKSTRLRRHGTRPRLPAISSVQIGFASIKTSLRSSLKSSVFKRTDHHSRPVFLVD